VGEVSEVIARPMTHACERRARSARDVHRRQRHEPLEGATVWVDGERRGYTPLVLELPRGPHSARVEYRGESAPVEVIDLPGGNQRFATFELGSTSTRPRSRPRRCRRDCRSAGRPWCRRASTT
jgi:hypothetical protein